MAQKTLSIKEFQDAGYLQEVNRLFFHPLGLALAIEVDEATKEVKLSRIIDVRDDPEGFVFDFKDMSFAEQERALHNWINVTSQAESKAQARIKLLGSVIEAVPGAKSGFDALVRAELKKGAAEKVFSVIYTICFVVGAAVIIGSIFLAVGSYFVEHYNHML